MGFAVTHNQSISVRAKMNGFNEKAAGTEPEASNHGTVEFANYHKTSLSLLKSR